MFVYKVDICKVYKDLKGKIESFSSAMSNIVEFVCTDLTF